VDGRKDRTGKGCEGFKGFGALNSEEVSCMSAHKDNGLEKEEFEEVLVCDEEGICQAVLVDASGNTMSKLNKWVLSGSDLGVFSTKEDLLKELRKNNIRLHITCYEDGICKVYWVDGNSNRVNNDPLYWVIEEDTPPRKQYPSRQSALDALKRRRETERENENQSYSCDRER
jgi:hypothetical protein